VAPRQKNMPVDELVIQKAKPWEGRETATKGLGTLTHRKKSRRSFERSRVAQTLRGAGHKSIAVKSKRPREGGNDTGCDEFGGGSEVSDVKKYSAPHARGTKRIRIRRGSTKEPTTQVGLLNSSGSRVTVQQGGSGEEKTFLGRKKKKTRDCEVALNDQHKGSARDARAETRCRATILRFTVGGTGKVRVTAREWPD